MGNDRKRNETVDGDDFLGTWEEWESWCNTISWILVILLNVLLLIDRHNRLDYLGVILIFISFANFYCYLSKTKTYQLFSNEKPTVATPSFSPNLDFRSPNLRKRVMHIETPERHGVDSSTRKSLGMISSLFGKKESAQPREERYLELSVWDPHPFFGNIFSFFSPAQALLLFLAWPSPLVKKLCGALLGHADQTPFLLMGAIVLGLQMQIVMRAYEGRRRDWNIVQGQVAAVQEDTAAVRYNQLRRNAIAAIKKWMGEAGALGSTPRHTSTPMKDPAVAAETTSPVPSYPDSPASSRKNVNNPFQSGRLSLDNVAPS